MLPSIKQNIAFIYNRQFREAEELFSKIEARYRSHPAIRLMRGMMVYWQNYPLTPTSPESRTFNDLLRKCIAECEQKEKGEDDPEILLTNLCARGLLLMHYSENNLSWEVMPLAASSYKYLRQAFRFTDTYPDFYFFTGLYNYYREAYPDLYPIYKTFVFVFPKGDRRGGIEQLVNASESAIFLRAESLSFLTLIYHDFEKDYAQSLMISSRLFGMHPGNGQYRLNYARNLIHQKRYVEAEKTLSSVNLSDNGYFRAEFKILKGVLYELAYSDPVKAEQNYLEGRKEIEPYGYIGNEFNSYACFGLSRIYKSRNNEPEYKRYRKLGQDLSPSSSRDN
jgi:hypothetical protein